MTNLSLSLTTARNLHLSAQGLLHPPTRKPRYTDIVDTIRRMSLLQIDTIHVVARSPFLVLFSRLGAYPETWLGEALATGELFEYWAHEACFIPAEDYRLLRHKMLQPQAMGWKYNAEWMAQHQHEVAELLRHIEDNGPVRSADFTTSPAHKPGWWSWKPHKRHLENLFTAGEVMVIERRNFQRVYDLRHRVLPEWDDQLHGISEREAVDEMLSNSAQSLGIFRPEWLADYYRLKRAPIKATLARWLEEGRVVPVNVEQLGQLYLHHRLVAQLEKPLKASHTTLLSPFDPVVWDRRRALELFNFDYRLECYTPEPKRKYGYFVLPILHRGALKGRLDAKMLRKEKTLLIKNLWLEDKVKVSASLLNDMRRALARFAQWQGAESIVFEHLPAGLYAAWGSGWQLD
ncbi:winged helix-turn-helix domain-containing protein [Paramixta manurensis]|uniref:Winged helix-turn-helix domain-containing protein n=1 Tax=Paramixta manurensis TaxID=2740817 RepID=A0A6M8UIF7_9GAMM|nr:winged helix-turn-helix domain-containing protein [Erwiniaceae bacterium PD-1]